MKLFWLLTAIALSGSLEAQTLTFNGAPYTLASHPRNLIGGSGSYLDTRIKDPDGAGPLVAPKATAGNPAWVALVAGVAAQIPAFNTAFGSYPDGSEALGFALYWYSDNSQTAAHDAAVYMLRHIEFYVPLLCVETQQDCLGANAASLSNWGTAYWMPNWIMTYELMYGELSSTDRQTFADKILNDNSAFGGIDGAPGTSCTNGTVATGLTITVSNDAWSVGAGSLTDVTITSNAIVNLTLSTPTTGMAVGGYVQLTGGTTEGFGNNGYPVLAINGPNSISIGYTGFLANGDYLVANPALVATYLVPFATLSGAAFGTTINTGDWLYTPTNAANLGLVSTIVDSTHAYVTGNLAPVSVDALSTYPHTWTPGHCGAVWVGKHYSWFASVLSGPTLYPPDGGTDGADPGHNLVYSQLWGMLMMFESLTDADANASVRSGTEFTLAANWWHSNQYALAKQLWTGFHQSGSGYGLYRAQQFMPGTAMAIESGLTGSPDLMGGAWAKNVMVSDYANAFPDAQGNMIQWGQPDVSGAPYLSQSLEGFAMMAYWFRATPEGAYANWWLQNMWSVPGTPFGNAPGTNLGWTSANLEYESGSAPPWLYLFTDASYTTNSLSSAPTTFAFNSSDTGTAGQRADALISRTGYFSTADTLLNFHAETIPEFDHNVFANQPSNYGSYKIVKGGYLLGEDYNIAMSQPSQAGFTVGGVGSNYVEVGGSDSNLNVATPVSSAIPRATGNNSYAYAMADVTRSYVPGVALSHGWRHLIDFKKPGTQQFIVDFMDFLTASGQTKVAYYHYPNLSTTTLAGSTVTSNNSTGVATQLLTAVLAPQTVLLAADTTSGQTFRLAVCPSLDAATCDGANTEAEMMVVHMPVAGTGNALPALELISSIDTRFRGAEIDGASPKIAVFARNGLSYDSTYFTASHTGTAQILIAGITPSATINSAYTLSLGGTPVATAQTVGPDGTFYYEGAPGNYTLAPVNAPPATFVLGSIVTGGTVVK